MATKQFFTIVLTWGFLALPLPVPAQVESQPKLKQRSLDEICEDVLAYKIVQSSIKRRLYHISKMKNPCRETLAKKNLTPSSSDSPSSPFATSPSSQQKLQAKYSSWGIDPIFDNAWINLNQIKKHAKKRRNVIVAVIDTGIDPDHEYLKDNIFVPEGVKGKNNYGRDFSISLRHSQNSSNGRAPIDDHGHGTHVAGILKSVFPEVKILPIKYYNPNRSGQENLNSLIRSLEYAVKVGVDIINYSGGGPEPAIEELKILKIAERKGILVVAAAGNEKSDIDHRDKAFYPASYGLSNIITVTAYDRQVTILNSSNWGKNSVDLAAPGHRIRSSVPHNHARHMTGTSQATAFVSGVVAMIKAQNPQLSAQEIKKIIRLSAKKVAKLQKKCVTEGKLDASEGLGLAEKHSPGKPIDDKIKNSPKKPTAQNSDLNHEELYPTLLPLLSRGVWLCLGFSLQTDARFTPGPLVGNVHLPLHPSAPRARAFSSSSSGAPLGLYPGCLWSRLPLAALYHQ